MRQAGVALQDGPLPAARLAHLAHLAHPAPYCQLHRQQLLKDCAINQQIVAR